MMATNDVRVVEMDDDEPQQQQQQRKRRKSEEEEEGVVAISARTDKAAARRANTQERLAKAQERRAAAKAAKEEAAERKRAERTRLQVRAQALKLGRKMHAALARGAAMMSPTRTAAAATNTGLLLAPIVSRPNGDLALQNSADGGGDPGRFEQSFQTLQQIAHSAAVPPPPKQQQLFEPPAATSTTLPGTPVRLPGVPVPPPPPHPPHQPQQQLPSPSYGALRGGSLPTYREYVAQQEHRPPPPRRTRAELELELTEDQRREQARLERELQELAVTQQYENLTRLYNTLPELRRKPIASGTRRADHSGNSSAAALRSVPQQRRTMRRVFHVGRTDKELSLLTHSSATRAGVDNFRLHVQSLSTDKMRRALLAAKLLSAGSDAPEPLLRRTFQHHQMLVGDLLVGSGSSTTSGDAVVSAVL